MVTSQSWQRTLTRWGSALALLWLACAAYAAGFFVSQAKTELVDGVYRLSAELRYELTPEVRTALANGLPMVFSIDIEIERPGAYYLWSESVASLKQQSRVQYHALSERYLLTNLNSGAQEYFANLDEAVEALRHVVNLPVIDSNLLARNTPYVGRVRTSLELDSLPVPLRYYAQVLPSWRLRSDWYSWPLTP